MAAFVGEHGVAEFEHIADPGGALWQAFKVTAQPSFVFINDSGKIVRHIGVLDEAELVEQLEVLLET